MKNNFNNNTLKYRVLITEPICILLRTCNKEREQLINKVVSKEKCLKLKLFELSITNKKSFKPEQLDIDGK